ncbi:MAG: YeeE/YedE thiosulfate transporter family protein [Verrucomicrobiota bacterium]|nr:YeeE/YedE thiosulfate transporter family protein [Verrucomicrobiota bacterium]
MEKKQSSIAAARAARRAARAKENEANQKKASKKGKIQITLGVLLFIAIIITGYVLKVNVSSKSALMWVFGISFGVTLQRARFCFTAAVRDPALTGSMSLAKSVLIAIGIATIGFAAIHYANGDPSTAKLAKGAYYFVKPVGLHTAVGAFLFGIGMVIAGGCASGTLMRIGEGFMMQMITLIFFICGVLLGFANRPFWKDKIFFKPVHFPKEFGWVPALFLQFVLLFLCFLTVEYISRKRKQKK